MNENINFNYLRAGIRATGMDIKTFALKCEKTPNDISMVLSGIRIPKTDFIAKMCSVLECYPSEIVTFKGFEQNNTDYYHRYTLPDKSKGLVTYKPFWLFLADYLDEHKDMTEKDVLDQIEPPKRLKGQSLHTKENIKKAVAARFGEGYVSKRTNRTDYSKGLTQVTRTKLRNDRPMNLAVIYEICKHFGCSIDSVLGYK